MSETKGEGHNSKNIEELVKSSAQQMAEIDAQRKELNRDAAEIRQTLDDNGVDKDAFKDVYGYFKKRRHERDGYDEYHKICMDALNNADTADMFAFTQKDTPVADNTKAMAA